VEDQALKTRCSIPLHRLASTISPQYGKITTDARVRFPEIAPSPAHEGYCAAYGTGKRGYMRIKAHWASS
jgi:hypothetical protein